MSGVTTYTPETGDKICALIAEGHSLRSICGTDGIPAKTTVLRWLADIEPFRVQYVRAREEQADKLFEEILEIADDGRNDTYVTGEGAEVVNHDHIQRSKLRVDARKWMAGKLAPKKYSDKIVNELSGLDGTPLKVTTEIILRGVRAGGAG